MNKKSNTKTLKIRKPRKRVSSPHLHEVVPFIPSEIDEKENEFTVLFESVKRPKYKTLKPRKSSISKKKTVKNKKIEKLLVESVKGTQEPFVEKLKSELEPEPEPEPEPIDIMKMNKMPFSDKNLKESPSVMVMEEPTATPTPSLKKRWNESFVDIMEQLAAIMMKQGEPFRAKAYQKAAETIMAYPDDITSVSQLKGQPGIGSTIVEKLNEFVETGGLKVLEREKANPVNVLTDVYGIGPKKAKELVAAGIVSIEQLREKVSVDGSVLNDVQRVGLKYYEDILKRIPRAEIVEYEALFRSVFVADSSSRFEIVGSYRRGALTSGDIDVIVTSASADVFKNFIDRLIADGVILEVLSRGPSKCLVVARLPGSAVARRVDFLYTSPDEYPFSVLYFTGSKYFNTVMRQRALEKGYTMNEHGLYVMKDGKKGLKVDHVFHEEADIFAFLGLVYKKPEERVDGRAVLPLVSELVKKEKVSKVEILEEPKEQEPEEPNDKAVKKTKKASSLVAKPKKVSSLVAKPKKASSLVVKAPKASSLKNKEKIIALANQEAKVDTKANIKLFQEKGVSFLSGLEEADLVAMLSLANEAYRNTAPIMTDNEYDILEDYVNERFPTNAFKGKIGAPVEKNKVKLPYEMASMDKIKPDTGILAAWKAKYSGPYVLSCKLDGVSGMYSTEGEKPKLYTRGDGVYGQDISYLIPFLKLPKRKGIVVRGEFILPKKTFDEKYKTTFANARNLVSGIVNRVSVDEKVKDLHFVAYEVIQPVLKPSEQMRFLTELPGLDVVLNQTLSSGELTNEYLSGLLVDWRKNYLYEIDGVIVTQDAVFARKSGNPDHSFAFKMVLSDQVAEAKVVDVLWTPSKDGYLKPRVQIEPLHLGGVKIEFATGFNGAFIEENKIGVGALIELVRSGDVIPYIKSVTVAAATAKMPDVPYIWNDTHVDVLLENAKDNLTVREKNITGFFRGIEVDGLSGGNVARIVEAGFDTVPKILKMEKADFLKVEGFKEKLATKIMEGIKEKVAAASLADLMSASNLFGRGFSEKKIELILEAYPDVLTDGLSPQDKIKRLEAIKGMAKKTAELFVEHIGGFVAFLKECGLESKILDEEKVLEVKVNLDESHPLYKKKIVMTGFRDEELVKRLKQVGATVGSSVSKSTFVLLVKNEEAVELGSSKIEEAKELGVPIMSLTAFSNTYLSN